MRISATCSDASPSAPRWWWRTDTNFVIPGWSEGPDLRCAIAHRGIPRFLVRSFSLAPRNDPQESEKPRRYAAFYLRSKIRGDAFVLPVAIAGRFRSLRTLKLFCQRPSICFRCFPARFGLGERALCRRRQLLAFRRRCGRDGL